MPIRVIPIRWACSPRSLVLIEVRHSQLTTIEGAPPDPVEPPIRLSFHASLRLCACYLSYDAARSGTPGANLLDFKACWVDVTDPQEQAYAEKRRQTRIEKVLAASNGQAASSQAVAEEK